MIWRARIWNLAQAATLNLISVLAALALIAFGFLRGLLGLHGWEEPTGMFEYDATRGRFDELETDGDELLVLARKT